MFTGLVEKTGVLQKIERAGGSGVLTLEAEPWPEPPSVGASIAVQGVCLTLREQKGRTFRFDLLEETLDKTNLGGKRPGALLNLERALRYGAPIGGHLLTGHVEGVGTVDRIEAVDRRDHAVWLRSPAELMTRIVPKGSIACDGVSLTIVDVAENAFSVHVIPHTWEVTAFSRLEINDEVNLETDILAKYAQRTVARGAARPALSWEALAEWEPDPSPGR